MRLRGWPAQRFYEEEKLNSMTLISVSTANTYFLPFEQTLEIIAMAGFEWIELDLFWEYKNWAMAQHLKGVEPRAAVRQIAQAGLKVSSIHDGGGVLSSAGSTQGFINPQLSDYLDALGYAPASLVFHTPHIEASLDESWWRGFSVQIAQELAPFRNAGACLTLENMPFFGGFYVAMTTPETLMAFACEHDLGVTLDTTHYAQMGVDILTAADILRGRVRTVHLSDYVDGRTHVFIGDGTLDLAGFIRTLEPAALQAITLECSLARLYESAAELTPAQMVERLKLARARVSCLCPIDEAAEEKSVFRSQ
jgi:sugar phosphate isomerase/epimerase